MTTIDKIRAEIERRNLANYCGTAEQYEEELFAILDTLEEPVSEDLEEEISRTYRDGSVTDTSDIDHVAYENIASHFAEWQKAKMMEGAVEVCNKEEEQ